MNYLKCVLFLFFILSYSFSSNKIIYLEPVPGASLVSINNSIIIGFQDPIGLNESELTNNIIVTGSSSMLHSGSVIICNGNKRIIFKPDVPFSLGETVSIRLAGKLLRSLFLEKNKNSFSFNFKTSNQKVAFDFYKYYKNELTLNENNSNPQNRINQVPKAYNVDSLPSDFPVITDLLNNSPTQGRIFLSDAQGNNTFPYLMILDNSGYPYWYRRMTGSCYDFKQQNPNMMTYFISSTLKFYALNSSYDVVDSFKCGNGYTTDLHELRILPNGHAFLLATDPEYVDMSHIIPGGDPNALVYGLIIQELDNNKNVIWQWRSWDHFQITDATHENLLAHIIDYVHGNAIETLSDGNILLSSRHMDEITKISLADGSMIWRMGGKNNQFNFLNDPIKFSHQHAVRELPNGNLTLFDNGNFHNPQFSRAVEYRIDENAKTVTLVWQYRNNPDYYSWAMGYVQRLSNGNTLIGWGATNPTLTEVKADGEKVLEMTFATGVFSYRAFKLEDNPLSNGNPKTENAGRFNLGQNFPNPFNPSTIISFSLSKAENVTLKVYDILGREVATLVNEFKRAGSYSVEFKANEQASGVYFYKLSAGEFSQTRKMMLVK